jgi:5-methylcytosine-specific restriction endonuclease McrA
MSRLSPLLRRRVQQRGQGLCEYCRSCMDYTGHAFTVDHVLPTSRGGTDDFNNLCFCCFWCNTYKHVRTQVLDVRTGHAVPLFNPRMDNWHDHFRWSPTYTRVVGRTAIGRVTIQALRLNRPSLVRARKIWVRHGLHPPE